MTVLLAADIGGTKTLVQVCHIDGATLTTQYQQRYNSQDYDTFDALLTDVYRHAALESVTTACFAVAGPVATDSNSAQVTNLPWQLHRQPLQTRFNIRNLALINDFTAAALGVSTLQQHELVTLQSGMDNEAAHKLIIGAGTGFGVAQLLVVNNSPWVLASEAGHADFAPNSAQQRNLLEYLAQRYAQVSIEHLLSGQGLVNIFEFMCASHNASETHFAQIQSAADPAAAISQAATAGEPLACQALELFTAIYGSVAGNLALTTLPYGGVYVCGGIAAKIIDFMQQPAFIRAFSNKSKMTALMAQFPVHVIMAADIGLAGARLHALQTLPDPYSKSRDSI